MEEAEVAELPEFPDLLKTDDVTAINDNSSDTWISKRIIRGGSDLKSETNKSINAIKLHNNVPFRVGRSSVAV